MTVCIQPSYIVYKPFYKKAHLFRPLLCVVAKQSDLNISITLDLRFARLEIPGYSLRLAISYLPNFAILMHALSSHGRRKGRDGGGGGAKRPPCFLEIPGQRGPALAVVIFAIIHIITSNLTLMLYVLSSLVYLIEVIQSYIKRLRYSNRAVRQLLY